MPVRQLLSGLAFVITLTSAAQAEPSLKRYELKYHILYSDLDKDTVAEAASRITTMAEEYYERTKGFAGKITKKFPFYLYAKAADYYAAGGTPGSAGVFVYTKNEQKLMAICDPRMGGEVWRTVQHEGFHQFAVAVIGGDLPIWVNEGMAEYFGESIWTGDGYVTGIVPPMRLARIKKWIADGKTASIKGMMQLTHEMWNVQLNLVNYDQAWSMVYFLGHARGGKYQDEFNGFISNVSRGAEWEAAWMKNFGTGVREFENQWKDYWRDMDRDFSKLLYARACVATLTSFYARAASQKQVFETAEAFFEAAKAETLKSHSEDWLPPALLERELKVHEKFGTWRVNRTSTRNDLILETPGGATLTGSFQLAIGGRVKEDSVKVAVKEPRKK